jgi:hypothetical protein
MRAADGTGLTTRITGGRAGVTHRGRLSTLLALTLLFGLLGLAAAAGASPARVCLPGFSADALLARLALQQAMLTPADGAAGDQFGYAVAIDGDTAVVGAPHHDPGSKAFGGAAYVFTHNGATWTQQALLVASDGAAADEFGRAVALSGDAVLIGSPQQDVSGKSDAGAAYLFTRSGATWTERQKLTAVDGAAGDEFGGSVALLGGETALVGANNHDVAGKIDAGAAYVFVPLEARPVWIQQAELTAADGAIGDGFGCSVAVSGETALIGAENHDLPAKFDAGAAYVFTRSAGVWTQQQMLSAADGAAGDFFGTGVALSLDTALVGATAHDSVGKADDGAAYVFTRSAGAWTQQQMLTAADGAADDELGSAVAVDGDTALVGAMGRHTGGGAYAGAAYVFRRSAGTWTQQPPLTIAGAAAHDFLGAAVALSGETALVAAPFRDIAGKLDEGAVYVFELYPLPTLTSFAPAAGLADTPVTLHGSGFTGATAVDFRGAAADFIVDSDTQITATVPKGAGSGPISVTGPGGSATSAASFTVYPAPILTKVHPGAGKRGALVSVVGKWFGAKRGTAFVRFGSKRCSTYVSWSNALIKCRVPATVKLGTVKVTVSTTSGESNVRAFLVKR